MTQENLGSTKSNIVKVGLFFGLFLGLMGAALWLSRTTGIPLPVGMANATSEDLREMEKATVAVALALEPAIPMGEVTFERQQNLGIDL